MQYQDDILPSDYPTPKQIAERLNLLLIQHKQASPIAISIDYDRFYRITGREKVAKSLYARVEFEAVAIGVVVGFGWNCIVITRDIQDDAGGKTIFVRE